MILSALITGAALIVGVSLLARFWNDITEWLKRAFVKVREIVNTVVLGTKIFIQKFGEAYKETQRFNTTVFLCVSDIFHMYAAGWIKVLCGIR